MKILGLAASDYDPASRFRIMQYEKYLSTLGTDLKYSFPYPPKESAPSKWVFKNKWLWYQCQLAGRVNLLVRQLFNDIIWQNRLLLSDHFSIEKFYCKKKLVADIDDAIWLTEGRTQVNKFIASARLIFAGNEYLAEYCRNLNKKIVIVPSVIDTNIFQPLSKDDEDIFTIGWIGTESNFKYLEIIRDPVTIFLSKIKNSRLVIVSSKKPAFLNFDNKKIIFQKWSKQGENNIINTFDTGIMPLTEDEWTKGKCGYKLLQYMSCNKAFIASPVGVNKSIINNSGAGIAAHNQKDWLDAFNRLYYDHSMRITLSEKGRPFVEKNYSCTAWAPKINEYFKQLI